MSRDIGDMDLRENALNQIEWMCFDDEDRPVCNFKPKDLKQINEIRTEGTVPYVSFKLCFKHAESDEIKILLSDLEKTDWCKLDGRCVFHPNYKRAKSYMCVLIRVSLSQIQPETWYRIDSPGIKHFGKTIVFAAGDRVITRSSGNEDVLNFDVESQAFRLDIDSELTKLQAFHGMQELISLSTEVGRVLVAYVISGIIGAAFQESGFLPCTILMIVGASGMLKSHYVPQLAQLYNRGDEIKPVTRVNSSQSFIEGSLNGYSECTAVIDDLHSASSQSIKKRNEETVEEIIRRISDNTGRGHTVGNLLVQQKFRGNVVFIGEYTVGRESTIPRVLIVEMTKRPDGKVLDKYQRQQPLLVSTFYYFFIQWYVDHYEEIRNEISIRLTRFRENVADSSVHGRLRDTQFCLQISYMIFLEFCRDSEFISEEDSLDEYRFFHEQINRLIQEQQKRFKSESGGGETDYLHYIQGIYKQGGFCVAKTKEEYNLDKYDGIIHYDCLCLRGKCLEKKIKKVNANFNLNDCIEELLAKNVLKLVGKKNTVQISGIGGKRFYAIKLDKLN